ncbi:MAG: hypothetical protein ACRCWJ_11135, partial [Casimicrobium sp.]
IDLIEAPAASVPRDPFNVDRRFEFRHPHRASLVAECAAGIDATPQSALALLAALETVVQVPRLVSQQVEALVCGCIDSTQPNH